MHHPILAELSAAGFDVHVEHRDGTAVVRVVEPKTRRVFTARGESEFMAALFAKGKVDLGLADEAPAPRMAA